MICHGRLNRIPAQLGFTLLEVLVAMALIGVGFSTAFVAISGTNRLTEKSVSHEIAVALARAKLDEVLNTPNYSLANDDKEERYAGNLYAYQIKVQPVDLSLPEQVEKSALPFVLENVAIDVFWGSPGSQQSYRLSTMRFSIRGGGSNQVNFAPPPGEATQSRMPL